MNDLPCRHNRAARLLAAPFCASLLSMALTACGKSNAPIRPAGYPGSVPPTTLIQDDRMAWWRDARFGLFVHWGLYAIPAGAYGGRDTYGEWIRDSARVPLDVYDGFQAQWNPTAFDADEWARLARAAGMKYVVITSKHHDGFCLYDSALTDWDVGGSPNPRDVLAELQAACERHGLRFCTYHSIMDWHHPDYLPRRPWELAQRGDEDADFERYEAFLHGQVREIIERYQPAVMWFDGEWESTWNHRRGVALWELCRELAPSMLVNNRVDVHRGGMAGISASDEAVGDFHTPEQEIPPTGLPGEDWESCMTMNSHWGWNAADTRWKSAVQLARNLIDIASKGGNYLLNVGPRADGSFPPEAVARLTELGAWMDKNGEAIGGTTASVFEALPFGRCTVRASDSRSTLYLHVFERPEDGVLRLPGLVNRIRSARVLGAPGAKLEHTSWGDADGPSVRLDDASLDPIASVVAVELDGRPDVVGAPRLVAEADQFVESLVVTIENPSASAVVRTTTDDREPNAADPAASAPLRLTRTTTLRAAAFLEGRRVSEVATRTFTRVAPWPARPAGDSPAGSSPDVAGGWRVERHPGALRALPTDLHSRTPATVTRAESLQLPEGVGENVALVYHGALAAPTDAVYRFALTSDDGSQLWIDDQRVVDHDGPHGATTKEGLAPLARGLHSVRVLWFNATGGAELDVRWAAPGGPFEALRAAR